MAGVCEATDMISAKQNSQKKKNRRAGGRGVGMGYGVENKTNVLDSVAAPEKWVEQREVEVQR